MARYVPEDIDVRRRALALLDQAGATEAGHAGALAYFFGDPAHRWQFANDTAFYRAAVLIAALSAEDRDAGRLPEVVAPSRRDATQAAPGGTVTIAGQRFADAVTLANSAFVAGLAAVGATVRSPAVAAIVADRLNGFAFPTWAAVAAAVGAWDGTGAIPQAVRAYRVPFRPESQLVRYDPTLAVDAGNVSDRERRFSYAWGTCGQTGQNLTGRLLDLGADIERRDEVAFGQGQGAQLTALLAADVDVLTVYEVYNPLLHHFVLEKRPADQHTILQQGYISAYAATWWAGLTPALFTLGGDLPRQQITAARANYGQAQPINLGALTTGLSQFLAAPRIDAPAALTAWQSLPFLPSAVPNHSTPPSWVVTVWSVNDPDTARAAVQQRLGAQVTSPWITQVVMLEAAEFWTRISAVRESVRV